MLELLAPNRTAVASIGVRIFDADGTVNSLSDAMRLGETISHQCFLRYASFTDPTDRSRIGPTQYTMGIPPDDEE